MITAAWRRAHGTHQGDNAVARASLAVAIRPTDDGLMVAIPAPPWAVCHTMAPAVWAAVRRARAASVRRSQDRKHPRGPTKKPPARSA